MNKARIPGFRCTALLCLYQPEYNVKYVAIRKGGQVRKPEEYQ
jgi:hypothetical protein